MNKADRPNISDHAREISFAVFRVCALIDQPVLRAALESASVNLTVKSVSGINDALVSINELEQLVRLAEAVGEIKPLNSKVLIRELSNLKSAVDQLADGVEDVDLEAMFGKDDKTEASKPIMGFPTGQANKSEVRSEPKPTSPEAIKFTKPSSLDTNQAGNRQSAILQFIKGLPNGCRMKDMIEKFPSVSERTLRNDLQALISNNSIERFGAIQGPFSYYRVKNKMFVDVSRDGFGSTSDGTVNSSSGGVTKRGIIAL
jgi:hypothetical protein